MSGRYKAMCAAIVACTWDAVLEDLRGLPIKNLLVVLESLIVSKPEIRISELRMSASEQYDILLRHTTGYPPKRKAHARVIEAVLKQHSG